MIEPAPKIHVPMTGRSRVYFVDEAGAKGSAGRLFVVAAVQVTDPDILTRAVQAVRDKHRKQGAYTDPHPELKFRKVTKGSLQLMKDVVDAAVTSGARFGMFVVDKDQFDPWRDRPGWEGNLFATDRLIRGMVTRRELAVVLLDQLPVPAGTSYGQLLRTRVNEKLKCMRVAAAVNLDSKSCDGLQVADIVASATYHYRSAMHTRDVAEYLQDQSPKAQLARHVAAALGIGVFDDVNADLVTIQTAFPAQASLPLDTQ